MRNYPAKLLLFGEHVLLLGASALAVPVAAFAGKWVQGTGSGRRPDYVQVLLQLADSAELRAVPGLDTRRMKQDVEAGWFFDSRVPVGYGLGSSGALCAAVYDRYAGEKTTDTSLLKAIFARMEGFFHGASSGIDPLTSYLDKPLLIQHKTEVSSATLQNWEQKPLVFLIDTQTPRQTGPLVRWFLEQSEGDDFSKKLHAELLPAHELMLSAWLAADPAVFWPQVRVVSRFQLEHFDPMIPDKLRTVWQKSLENPAFSLKICGAGGGGFLLGFAENRAALQELEAQFPIVFPFETDKQHENG